MLSWRHGASCQHGVRRKRIGFGGHSQPYSFRQDRTEQGDACRECRCTDVSRGWTQVVLLFKFKPHLQRRPHGSRLSRVQVPHHAAAQHLSDRGQKQAQVLHGIPWQVQDEIILSRYGNTKNQLATITIASRSISVVITCSFRTYSLL